MDSRIRSQHSGLAAIHDRIRRYNSDIDPESDSFRAALLLLAGVQFGHNIDLLARRTGLDRSFVARCARRLTDNGVWRDGTTIASWSAADEASGAFWNDVAVAEGKLCRRLGEDGVIEWAPAGYWNKSYGFIDPDAEDAPTATYHDPGCDDDLDPAADPDADTAPGTTPVPAPEAAGNAAPPATTPEPAVPANGSNGGAAPIANGGRPTPPNMIGKRPPPPPFEIFADAVWLE